MIKLILNLAYPVIISRLLTAFLDIFSVFFVAKMGVSLLSAYGIAVPVYSTIYMLAISYLLIFSIKLGHLRDHLERMRIYFNSGIYFSLLLSLLVAILFFVAPFMILFFGQTIAVSQGVGDFLHFIIFGMPAVFMSAVVSQVLIVFSRSFLVTLSSFIQLIAGLFLIYIFTMQLRWGLRGIAIGFDIAYWLRFFILSGILIKLGNPAFKLQFERLSQFYEDILFFFKLGWPISIQYGGELLAGLIATLMIGHLYVHALAAQQAATQLGIFFLMLPYGLGQAVSILVSQHKVDSLLGFKTYMKKLFNQVFFLGFLLIIIALILANVFSIDYIQLFLHGDEGSILVHLARIFIIITSFALLLDTAKYLVMGLLRGLKNTKACMLRSLASYYVIGIPSAYILGYVFHMGPVGIRFGMCFGLLCSVLIIFSFYFKFVKAQAHSHSLSHA